MHPYRGGKACILMNPLTKKNNDSGEGSIEKKRRRTKANEEAAISPSNKQGGGGNLSSQTREFAGGGSCLGKAARGASRNSTNVSPYSVPSRRKNWRRKKEESFQRLRPES